MPYDVEAIRKKLKQQMSGKFVDPDEFRPPKAESTSEPVKYRFFILPPLMTGDVVKGSTVTHDMDHFFLPHANHWVNDRPHPCPRVWSGEEHGDCAVCQVGFDMLKEEKDENARKEIIKQWMPNTYYMVNIYFVNSPMNPEDLRGQVKFFNAPKTLFDTWTATLMREGSGDPEDPVAHGVFFDESAAFMFQLEVLKFGRNNSYKTSKFVANGGNPQPMLKDLSKLPSLLKMRHNLFEKVERPNVEAMRKLARLIVDGDDGGFDEDDTKPSSNKPAAAKTHPKNESIDKAATKQADADDIIEDELYDDEPTPPKAPAKAPAKAAVKAKPEPKPVEDDDDGIDALLDQLSDDE